MRETVLQDFEWYLPADAGFWRVVAEQAPDLERVGFSAVWLPPAYKGQAGSQDVGYGVYDLFDLGEFDQKGTVPTKYGTLDEYLAAVDALHGHGVKVIGDIVLNHRMGADEKETVSVNACDPRDRLRDTSGQFEADVWTKYTFPGRGGAHDGFTWDATDFTGTDHDDRTGRNDILSFEGKSWNSNVSKEDGNFDFIMGDDVDFSMDEVVGELTRWGRWYTEKAGLDGFRIDAVKSIDSTFFGPWLEEMEQVGRHPVFAVGEFWSGDTADLEGYLDDSGGCMRLFDVPLHFKLQQASLQPSNYDMHQLFDRTITQGRPDLSCPFVDNHDTQPGQALESWVADGFKTRAYATVLLRDAQVPFVFYGDLWGIPHDGKGPVPFLREMVWVRSHLLGDDVVDMNDGDHQKMCWLVRGEHPVFVIWTGGDWKQKDVVEPTLAGTVFVDVCDPSHRVAVADDGRASFTCGPDGTGVYIVEADYERLKRELYY